MTALTNVFLREYRERKSLLIASLVAGLLPFPLAMGVQRGSGFSFAESRDAGALVIALAIGLSVAMALGATIMGRELTEGRLGFFYSRPIPSLSIWGGKLLAAYALALSAAGLSLLPTTLVGGGALRMGTLGGNALELSLGRQALSAGTLALGLMAVMALAIAVANALSIMGRSRSSLLMLLDLVLVSAVVGAASLGVRMILGTGGLEVLIVAAIAALILLLAALLAAGAVQACVGRTDPVRSHRALSATLWTILGAGVLGFLGYAWWFGAVSPKDLRWVGWGTASPGGGWVAVAGDLRHRGRFAGSELLFQPATGRFVRTGPSPWGSWVQFSSDGRVAAWMEGGSPFSTGTQELVTLDLASPGGAPRPTGITIADGAWWFSLSPDGTRVATYSSRDVAVCEVATGRVLASASLSRGGRDKRRPEVFWAGEGRLLLYDYSEPERAGEGAGGFDIFEFDLGRRRLMPTGRVESDDWGPVANPACDRVLLRRRAGNSWDCLLCDARSGRVLATLAHGLEGITGEFVGDGRAVLAGRVEGVLKVLVCSSEGAPIKTIDLGHDRLAVWGGEPSSGKILLAVVPEGQKGFRRGSPVLVDLGTGSVRRLGDRLLPLGWSGSWRVGAPSPRGAACDWFTDDAGSLVRMDLGTGALTVVLKGDGRPVSDD